MGLFVIGRVKNIVMLVSCVSEKNDDQAPRKEHFVMEQPPDAIISA